MDAFARMVGDCPAAFFNLAVSCCNVSARFWSERACRVAANPYVTPVIRDLFR